MIVKAVIFDLDGTIASFNLDYRAVRAEARSLLMKTGLPASVLSIDESIFEMLKKTEIFMKNAGKTQKAVNDVRSRVLEIAEKYELEAAKNTSLFSGVIETLEALKKMNLKIGLCTINGGKSSAYILRRFKIARFFDVVTPRDNVRNVKPNPEHLKSTLRALKVKSEQALVVGDGTVDVKCAAEMKSIAVGLPTGISTSKELIRSGASYVITAITDLPRLVDCINRILEK